MRLNMPRDFYYPKGSPARRDDQSDAVAYLWTNASGKPGATIFVGKRAKPLSNYYYQNEARRDAAVAIAFDSRRKSLAFKSERREQRKAWVCTFKAGDVFKTSWGYEQTNIEYFELVEMKGKHGILRQLAVTSYETGFMQGKCAPLKGKYIGDPIRKLCQPNGFKMSSWGRWATKIEPKIIAGVEVYDAGHWTAYA